MKKIFLPIFALMALSCFAGCEQNNKSEKTTKEVSSSSQIIHIKSKTEFDNLIKNEKFVIAKFTAQWCGACRIMAPIFKKSSEKFGNKVKFAEVNVDQNGAIAQEYGIRGIPAFIYFKDGKKSDQKAGAMSENEFETKINNFIK